MLRILYRTVNFCTIFLAISAFKACLGLPLTGNPIACSSVEGPKISPTRVERSHDFFVPRGKSTGTLIPVMRTGRSVTSLIPAMRTGRSFTGLIPMMRTGRSMAKGLIPMMRTGRSMAKSLIPMMRTGRSDPNKTTAEGLTNENGVEYTSDLFNKWPQSRYSLLLSNILPSDDSQDSLRSATAQEDPLNSLRQNVEYVFDEDP